METDERGVAVWRGQEITGADALAQVYRDVTLVTALDPSTAEQVGGGTWTGVPTSSSTLPSLMAGMLEELRVVDGQRVLEVGTGTGYNAALLCARLGDRLVHSVDIDPGLIASARGRLAGLGYAPDLAAGDGRSWHPSGRRFERIIATCSVPRRLPAAWIEQAAPDAVILADVDFGIEGGLVRVCVDGAGRARGRFAETSGRFMAARGDAHAYPAPEPHVPYAAAVGTRPTAVSAADIRAHYPFRLLLALELPDAQLTYHHADDQPLALQLHTPDGSWARAPLSGGDGAEVAYGGGADLWGKVEGLWEWWCARGRPAQEQFGYAQEAGGEVRVWHLGTGRRWGAGA
ncbi:methyltransferase domain-containing protein [Streptomyces sp. HSW2009]|uniref:methyltransferase domain-containing protein n=1 Tax=Streptomyces sp. HSW2009 TaxID=3142890 RepID=UPI0032EF887B